MECGLAGAARRRSKISFQHENPSPRQSMARKGSKHSTSSFFYCWDSTTTIHYNRLQHDAFLIIADSIRGDMRPVMRGLRRRGPQFYAKFLVLSVVLAVVTLGRSSQLLSLSQNESTSSSSRVDLPLPPKSYASSPTLSSATKLLDRAPSEKRRRAVFYNIFIPDGEFKEHALGIVKEQILLKQKSDILKSAPLFYTLIGANATTEIAGICRSFHESSSNLCHELQHATEGDEGLTLQSVYEHCREHPETQVTYLHNKGSFHPSERNEKFRAFLNRGIFGDDCQEMPLESCNVCASRFSTFPHFHMAGNMWTATCDYIQRLESPSEFPAKMESMLEWIIMNKDPVIPKPTFKQYQDGYPVGRGRFAFEHWLGSHPQLLPCDVYARKYTHGYRDLPSLSNYWQAKLATAPRFDIHTFLRISMLRGEWFCGQARLLEYAYLYDGLQPPPDHFVWKYYLEAYKGCDVPLNQSLHKDMFRDKIPRQK